MALAETSADILNQARKMAMGEPEELIGVILSRADLQNGRLLVRYLFIGIPYEMQPRWHAYGTLPVKFLAQLWTSRSIAHGIDRCLAFDHPLSRALAKALDQVAKGSSLPTCERVLLSGMLGYQEEVLGRYKTKDSSLVRELLARTLDVWNLNIWSRVFAGVLQKEKAAEFYLEGGYSLSIEKLLGSSEPAELLASTPWEKALERTRDGPPIMAPGGAMREFWRWQISQRRKDPLGIEVALAFIAHQLVEWQNLDSLVVGVSMGFEGDAILDKLILAG
jgi:V/A-type H+-transporting ATPase subunit C